MEEEKKPIGKKGLRATSEEEPSQGADFTAAFTPTAQAAVGLSANIVDIQKGAVSRDKLERKVLGAAVKKSVPSKVATVEPVVITVEKGTGTIPEEGTYGSLAIIDLENAKKKTCAEVYVQKVGEEKYEDNNIITVAVTFECNALWVETAYTAGA